MKPFLVLTLFIYLFLLPTRPCFVRPGSKPSGKCVPARVPHRRGETRTPHARTPTRALADAHAPRRGRRWPSGWDQDAWLCPPLRRRRADWREKQRCSPGWKCAVRTEFCYELNIISLHGENTTTLKARIFSCHDFRRFGPQQVGGEGPEAPWCLRTASLWAL